MGAAGAAPDGTGHRPPGGCEAIRSRCPAMNLERALGHKSSLAATARGGTVSASVTQVARFFVPVSDRDRALEFYVERLGFEKRSDFAYGGGKRWVEVAPPDSAIAL